MIDKLIIMLLISVCACSTPFIRRKVNRIKIQDRIYYRLPSNAKPLHYNLTLEPNFETFKFFGSVQIDVQITETSDNITLHSYDLELQFVKVLDSNSKEIPFINFTRDVNTDFLIIHFKQNLTLASYKLQIYFTGMLNKLKKGFYRINYKNANGEIKWLAATQFEPTEARRAFPCFDEPGLKATYDVNLVRNSSYNSVSNMKLSHTWKNGTKFVDVFERSPNMSSYVPAFVVSDFTYIVDNKGNRLFAKPKAIANGNGNFSLEISSTILSAIENYTNVSYSLSKLDQIAIPNFMFVAMENWGLICYNESSLLWNAKSSSTEAKQLILDTITHEFIHQWFGNLVTPKWWKYLWLSEGIATFLTGQLSDLVKPAWRMKDQYASIMQFTLDVDSKMSRPLDTDAESPGEIKSLMDFITYFKAGGVFRMLQHAISDLLFRAGLTRYLTNMQYNVVEPADLWRAFQEIINSTAPDLFPDNLTISEIMATWETQAGYPVITATRMYKNKSVTFSQEICLTNGTNPNDTSRWYVPLNYASENNPNFTNTQASHWMTNQNDLVLNLDLPRNNWLIVNIQGTGFYRVNYDEKNWNLITSYLNTTDYDKIHVLNRAQLIADAFNLAKSGYLNYTVALNVINYLDRESDYVPHSSLFRAFQFFNRMASTTELYHLFEKRISVVLNGTLNKLGFVEVDFSDAEHINNLHRILVIIWACRMNSSFCRNQSIARFSNISSISTNLQLPILCGGLRGANETTWNVIDKFANTAPADKKKRLLSALGCSENVAVLTKYVEREILKGSSSVFQNIFNKGNFGKEFVLNYIIDNYVKIFKRFDLSTGDIIIGLASQLSSQQHLSKLQLLRTKASVSLYPSIDQAIKTVKRNVKWTNAYLSDITAWIVKHLQI